jgi:hypothetical protein
LQSCNWRRVELMFAVETPDCRRLEALLHQFFNDRHIRREWFKVQPDDVRQAIETLKPLMEGR